MEGKNIPDHLPGHKAGFVTLIGKPNAGKSTLMNRLVGERLAIATAKAQTTRHRIRGILSGENYQLVYSDTPGLLEPNYELQRRMMAFVHESLEDADILLYILALDDAEVPEYAAAVIEKALRTNPDMAIVFVLNKADLVEQEAILTCVEKLKAQFPQCKGAIPVSALHNFNVQELLNVLLEYTPEHPPFFPEDTLTDRSERFFAAEILREKIFLHYSQEIPYASEVSILSFKPLEKFIHIRAEIHVERDSQKGILIGKGGRMLRKIGEEARKDMESFFGQKVFLEQYVRVAANWRKTKRQLDRFGYSGGR